MESRVSSCVVRVTGRCASCHAERSVIRSPSEGQSRCNCGGLIVECNTVALCFDARHSTYTSYEAALWALAEDNEALRYSSLKFGELSERLAIRVRELERLGKHEGLASAYAGITRQLRAEQIKATRLCERARWALGKSFELVQRTSRRRTRGHLAGSGASQG